MNRLFYGALLTALGLVAVPTTLAQQFAPPVGYPVQPAVYQAMPNVPPGVQPAMGWQGMPGAVQPAACTDCGPGPVDYGMGSMMASDGCYGGECGGSFAGLGSHFTGGQGFAGQHCGLGHGPCGDGGCCQPRWFDFQAEWLFWQRDFDDNLQFSSLGILGPNALDANMLDEGEESGFRVTGAYLIHPSTALEVSYFGGFNWSSSVTATSDGNLYSVFSDFGSNPFNGFPETAQGLQHHLGFSSEMDNAELNVRHRFVSANCLIHTSILGGVRYVRLREDLVYATQTATDSMQYLLKTDNDLVGIQTGGELYLCVTPRFRIGGDVKAGVYGTASKARTSVTSSASPDLREYTRDNDVAFVGEAGVTALFKVTSQWTFRAGYQVMYIDGISTAVDNFNTESPFNVRSVVFDNGSDVFFHGTNVGFEYSF